ncbi:hypothetical protein [Dyadobacter fanqingshengii]|uniref:Uncharacterized protein n=1 Tax=Dyadobacter fanqingshengii TaxID=2906443 RepID=A0A9X1P8W0_9BACT|nr:hypothetical protein [Dyadobacter fanqingshengii]MCF0040839.1 hypothetical protein [Dyadobacter fanqingshengii]USJ37427.1 hypothetical protein NFI81_06510 [Dyadobacter fanqingshengii]
MKFLFISILILSQVFDCTSEDSPLPASEAADALYQQFHGKYKIVSSVSSEPLDVNLDGESSMDLLAEIEELPNISNLDIRIYAPSDRNPRPTFIFTQAWPEQSIRMGSGKVWDGIETISFNPAYNFSYNMKVVARSFNFSEDLKQLIVTPDDSEDPFFRQSAPKSVLVKDDGTLAVIANRRIYTSNGVREVTVTTIYERFTMST